MKFTEAMIAWNPGTEEILVGLWPDATGWSDAYSFTAGACDTALHKMQPGGQRAMLMTCFNGTVNLAAVRLTGCG